MQDTLGVDTIKKGLIKREKKKKRKKIKSNTPTKKLRNSMDQEVFSSLDCEQHPNSDYEGP